MEFKKGDILYVTDEDLKGEVIDFSKEQVTIVSEDGFEYEFPYHKVYKINSEGNPEHRTTKYQFDSVQKEKRKGKNETVVNLRFDSNNTEVDLHMETLAPGKNFLHEYEALDFQLNCVREILRIANRKRIRKFTLIHGVGKGKLRKELRELITSGYPSVEYLDGNYMKYGGGATELIIHQFDNLD